jgi:hypothetical protein
MLHARHHIGGEEVWDAVFEILLAVGVEGDPG